MAGNRSIEPLLEQLYGSMLDPDGLRKFVGSLDSYSDNNISTPSHGPLDHAPPIWFESINQPAAITPSYRRRPKSAGDSDHNLVQLLLPHLRNFYAIQRRLSWLEAQMHTFRDALNRLTLGIVLLDAYGQCLFANPQAQLLLADHDGIQLVQGRLRASIASDHFRLCALIDLAVGSSATLDARLLLHGSDGHPGLVLTISTLRDPVTEADESTACAIVFAQPVVPHPRKADAILKELFGFTTAESLLALALFDTGDLAKACERLGKSMGTGRVQLRMLMEKTGCHRQSGLFRVLSAALSLFGERSSQVGPHNPFG